MLSLWPLLLLPLPLLLLLLLTHILLLKLFFHMRKYEQNKKEQKSRERGLNKPLTRHEIIKLARMRDATPWDAPRWYSPTRYLHRHRRRPRLDVASSFLLFAPHAASLSLASCRLFGTRSDVVFDFDFRFRIFFSFFLISLTRAREAIKKNTTKQIQIDKCK